MGRSRISFAGVQRLGWTRTLAITLTAVVMLGSCTKTGPASMEGQVSTIEIDHPISEPTWSEGAVFGLVEKTRQVMRIELDGSTPTKTRLSDPLAELGKNLVREKTRKAIYVPQPNHDRVVMLDDLELTREATFEAGHAPEYLAVDVGSRILLALSEDGSTVTAVRVRGHTAGPPHEVHGGPEAELDGPQRGLPVDYFVAGPEGIAHYKGDLGEVEKTGDIKIKAHQTAGDLVKVSRLYVAEDGTNRLLAVGVKPGGDGLTVAATADLGAPVEHVGVDSMRVYAATREKLVVLESDTYEGYENRSFSIVDTIDFREALPTHALTTASLSGIAVGENKVYLSFRAEPYLVRIEKPQI